MKQIRKSFGLIEVLVSVAIIAMVLTALVGLASSSVKTSVSTEKRLKAVYLAREGNALVRQIKDTHRLNPASCDISPNLFYYDYSNHCLEVFENPFYQIFDNKGDDQSVRDVIVTPLVVDEFGRQIDIRDIGGGTLFEVTSTVIWNDIGGTQKSVVVTSYLSTWW